MKHAESTRPGDAAHLLAALRAALDGSGPAVAPLQLLHPGAVPPGTAVVVRTSGSTGAPREVALPAAALRASADATHARLGGPGRWLLTLPPTHVAGLQVLSRSVVAGTDAVVAAPGPFTAAGFAALVARAGTADGVPRYTSLVPTQLHRLVAAADAGDRAGLDALAALDAVLLGGAATPEPLLARARAAGVRVVTTYGMSETCGGCVYDGVPLDGVRVRLVPAPGTTTTGTTSGTTTADGAGVVELGGPVLAAGYLGDPAATAAAFRTDDDGTRWFRTSDLGALDGGVLRVLGRADDVLVSGGVNVAPAAVEAVLVGLPGVGEACVVGVPDPEWGQAVVAVVTPSGTPGSGRAADAADGLTTPDPALLAAARAAVTDRLGAPSAPRRLYVTAALPLRGPGKVDRAAVASLARALGPGDAPGR